MIGNAFSSLHPDWKVDLVHMKCEIVAVLQNETIVIGINISLGKIFLKNCFPSDTRENRDDVVPRSLQQRDAGSMRSSTAALVLALLRPLPGDVLVDGLCGNGNLVLQAAKAVGCMVLGGDYNLLLRPAFGDIYRKTITGVGETSNAAAVEVTMLVIERSFAFNFLI